MSVGTAAAASGTGTGTGTTRELDALVIGAGVAGL